MARLLTFKDYLRIIDEDVSTDIEKLRSDISMIDATIAQRTNPLIQQKTRLQKQLAIKERQRQAEVEKQGTTQPGMQAGQQGSQATTPGSTGASTPG